MRMGWDSLEVNIYNSLYLLYDIPILDNGWDWTYMRLWVGLNIHETLGGIEHTWDLDKIIQWMLNIDMHYWTYGDASNYITEKNSRCIQQKWTCRRIGGIEATKTFIWWLIGACGKAQKPWSMSIPSSFLKKLATHSKGPSWPSDLSFDLGQW
jgi:hypothetical protein